MKWTESDLKFLRDNYPSMGTAYCAEKLNRSRGTIATVAHNLGIKFIVRTKTNIEFDDELFSIQSDAFRIGDYVNAHTPIEFECTKSHQWLASPTNILSGRGCPKCLKSCFDKNEPATLYYIKIGIYYKLGITNRDIGLRFIKDRDKTIKILHEEHFNTGSDALAREQELLKKFNSLRVNIPGYLKSGGNTELFESDILELDKC